MPVVVVEEEAPGVRLALVGRWVELAMAGAIVVRGVATGPLLRTGSDALFVFFSFGNISNVSLYHWPLFSIKPLPLNMLTPYYHK